jgi:transcriptional regulator with XRE-family HTH domain
MPDQQPEIAFPERLRSERERLGLTQIEFGQLGGVSKITQWNYEAGRHWPTLDYIEALRASAKVDVVYLTTGTRMGRGELDWPLLKNAFLFAQRSFAQRPNRNFTDEQLFDVFKSVVETSLRFTCAREDKNGAAEARESGSEATNAS